MNIEKGSVLRCITTNRFCCEGSQGAVIQEQGADVFGVLIVLPNRTIGRYTLLEIQSLFEPTGEINKFAQQYHYLSYLAVMKDIELDNFSPLELR